MFQFTGFPPYTYGFSIRYMRFAHVGSPIQISMDQRSFAPPHGFSQHIREVMDRLYSAAPDGYCGDEDNGQTSAWYIFSALGFYPVCPASDEYAIGTPYFPHARILLENGKTLDITARNARKGSSSLDCYIGKIQVNGREYKSNFLNYSDLISGATIEYTMVDTPEQGKN